MPPDRRTISAEGAPAALGPYSHAVRSGDLVFLSGQTPLDPATGKLVEGGLESEVKQCMQNLEQVLTSIGLITRNVVKTTVFVTDLNDLKMINDIYAHHFKKDPPARSIVEVRQLPLKAKIMIDAIAETY